MAANLSSLLSSSRQLTSHLNRTDLPSVKLSFDQIEAESRRLARQPGSSADADRANFLLAKANVDPTSLTSSIAQLQNTAASTFTPLQALQDTDVQGYLRISHEQNLISTIEEGRARTQREFYQLMEARRNEEWEKMKARVFEQLGQRADQTAVVGPKRTGLASSTSVALPTPTVDVQAKMLNYDKVVGELNAARLRNQSFAILHALMDVARKTAASDPKSAQFQTTLHILTLQTREAPSHDMTNNPGSSVSRKFAKVYLDPGFSSNGQTREAVDLRTQIARGAREALEEQYFEVVERTVMSRREDAPLGGDPSIGNKIRSFLLIRYHQGKQGWPQRIEIIQGVPIWGRLFFLIRTGYLEEAVEEAVHYEHPLESVAPGFVECLQSWANSPERRISPAQRQKLQSHYHSQMLHGSSADPFRIALYKLVGKLEPERRRVELVTETMEDWLWWQISMLDEQSPNNLSSVTELLLTYGDRHFEENGAENGKGLWATVLTCVGQYERAVAALWSNPSTQVEAVHLGIALAYHGLLCVPLKAEVSELTPLTIRPDSPPAFSLSTIIWRYVRLFMKMDPKEALHYIATIPLSHDQDSAHPSLRTGAGKEQLKITYDLLRRLIVQSNPGPQWDALIGGFHAAPTASSLNRFPGLIEGVLPLLELKNYDQYVEEVLKLAANDSQREGRIVESVKLWNLASEYEIVVEVLAAALGNILASVYGGEGGMLGEKEREIERVAGDVMRTYERMNQGAGKERDAVARLLRIRDALEAKKKGRFEYALEVLQSTDLLPLGQGESADVSRITRRAEEFAVLSESLQRNLQVYLPLAMDLLASLHRKTKTSPLEENVKHAHMTDLRRRSRALIVFAGMLKYRMSADVYSYLARLDVEIAL
ncbi:nucleoporin-interacting protein NIC96 [Flagelloscypha sp. PMI_526]|nr:nucleoporin-interacting protein NIC96 [Flagelloscypha sp. PMI_526]